MTAIATPFLVRFVETPTERRARRLAQAAASLLGLAGGFAVLLVVWLYVERVIA